MLGAVERGAAAALGEEPWMLLRPVVKATGSHPATSRHVTPTSSAVSGDEGALVHGQGAVVSGEVQWEVLGRQAVLQVVEGGVRILEACRGGWVSGGKGLGRGTQPASQGREVVE